MRIAIAGGTGTVGAKVTDAVRARGHEPVVLSRSTGIDLVTGAGLDVVLAGVDAVIDVSNTKGMTKASAVRYFQTATATLLAAEQRAGIGHHVALSIVGIDTAADGYGYYQGKLAQEQAVRAGSVPCTILRATQFYEFAQQMFDRTKVGPFVIVPAMRCQPVAAADVAERLVDLAESGPSGRVTDLAGPRVERMSELARRFGRAAARKGRVVEITLPGRAGKHMRNGALLPGPDAQLTSQTFLEWLKATTGSDGESTRTTAKGFGGIVLVRPPVTGPPEPSLSNVPELIAGLQQAGMPITLTVEGTPRRLPVRIDETAFRALQEGTSLVLMRTTNVEAVAVVRYLTGAVEVEVSHGPANVADHSEQLSTLSRSHPAVRALGGAVDSVFTGHGGLRVSATIPTP